MEVHKKKISRSNVTPESNYQNYREKLRQDFYNSCGYCGKTEQITKRGFEIDHFIPIRLAPEKKTDYDNLVYSCFNCNRKKGKKFPTEDKMISFKNDQGILDPASEEFDRHLERLMDGKIVGKTKLGRYICEEIFKFQNRPMGQIWKAMQIMEKKEELEKRYSEGKLTCLDFGEYFCINQLLSELFDLFFNKSE